MTIWIGLAGLQATGILWYSCAWKQYQNRRLTERVLKPKMIALLGITDFWTYEDQLRQDTSTRNAFDWWSNYLRAFVLGRLGGSWRADRRRNRARLGGNNRSCERGMFCA